MQLVSDLFSVLLPFHQTVLDSPLKKGATFCQEISSVKWLAGCHGYLIGLAYIGFSHLYARHDLMQWSAAVKQPCFLDKLVEKPFSSNKFAGGVEFSYSALLQHDDLVTV